MSLPEVFRAFANDELLKAVLVLIALDFALGTIAAIKDKTQEFSFAYLSKFAQDDVLGKVVPWFVIYAAAKFAPSTDILGVDLDAIQKGVFALVAVALAGSLLNSLSELGLKVVDKIPGVGAGKLEA